MAEEVYINNKSRTIHIKSTGEVTANDLKRSLSEIIKFKKEKGFSRILVDHTESKSFPGPVAGFNFGAEISLRFQDITIALVTSKHAENDLNFFKDVVSARGINAQIFHSEKPAIQWLAGQPG